MRGYVANELDVDASADDVWAVYRSHDLPKLIIDLQPGVFDKIDIVEGNGGQGTVLHIILAPGSKPRTWCEKFEKIDDETRTKVVRQVKGGFLALGFHFYEEVYHVIEKGPHSCTIKSSANFEVPEEHESNASLITADTSWGMAKSIANYVVQKNN